MGTLRIAAWWVGVFIITFSVPHWLGGNQFGYQHELISLVALR
jgi:predicted CDP-diglyceride synthetase/phosphatidate cytidylyltransferase